MHRFVAPALGLLVALTSSALAQTYFSTDQMIIPINAAATGGRAGVYPSTINVSGGPARIQDITVTLTNMQHGAPSDFNVLLVGPQGQKVLLMRGCGGNQAISLTTVNFNQNAAASLTSGGKILPGTYKPTQFGAVPLPPPAPGTPYDTSLGVFTGTNANGAWTLYVWDDFNDAAGGAINGWSLNFTGQTQTSFTYQGVLEKDGTPISGDANVRFTLHGGAVSSVLDQPLAGPIVRSLTGLESGLFTTDLDFGSAVFAPRELWLGIEVESPPGSGYTPISPRTRLAIVPIAGRALNADKATTADRATTADSATTAGSAPWSGITGAPLAVANPPRVFSFVTTPTSNTITPVSESQLPYTVLSGSDFQAGIAVVDFSISGFTNIAQTGFQFRFRIGNTYSSPVNFFFNQAGVHQSFSGKVVIPVPAGSQACSLWVTRTFGSGSFQADTGDSVTYTILNFRQ
jgi:subtilisin-like proprotein convertase family protein